MTESPVCVPRARVGARILPPQVPIPRAPRSTGLPRPGRPDDRSGTRESARRALAVVSGPEQARRSGFASSKGFS